MAERDERETKGRRLGWPKDDSTLPATVTATMAVAVAATEVGIKSMIHHIINAKEEYA